LYRVAASSDDSIPDREHKENESGLWVFGDKARDGLTKPSPPEQRPPPRADGAVSHSAKPRIPQLQPERAAVALFGTPTKFQDLSALPNALAQTPKPAGLLRAQIDLFNPIRLAPVLVPWLVFRAAFGEVLRLGDYWFIGNRRNWCVASEVIDPESGPCKRKLRAQLFLGLVVW